MGRMHRMGLPPSARGETRTAVNCHFFVQHLVVQDKCMARTTISIDDDACAEVMRRYRLTTREEAVNFALRTLAGEAASLEEARAMRGSGWDGDLDAVSGTVRESAE